MRWRIADILIGLAFVTVLHIMSPVRNEVEAIFWSCVPSLSLLSALELLADFRVVLADFRKFSSTFSLQVSAPELLADFREVLADVRKFSSTWSLQAAFHFDDDLDGATSVVPPEDRRGMEDTNQPQRQNETVAENIHDDNAPAQIPRRSRKRRGSSEHSVSKPVEGKVSSSTTAAANLPPEMVPIPKFLELLKKDIHSVRKASRLVRDGRIDVTAYGIVDGERVPLVLQVLNFYQGLSVGGSLQEQGDRKRAMLDVLASMFTHGANPNEVSPKIFNKGLPALLSAITRADVELCHCLVRAGATISQPVRSGEEPRGLAFRTVAEFYRDGTISIKQLMSLRLEKVAGVTALGGRDMPEARRKYEHSSTMRNAVLEVNDIRAASEDCPRSVGLDIDIDMMEAFWQELRVAPDFDIKDALISNHAMRQNLLHAYACTTPRPVQMLVQTALAAGATAASAVLHALQSGDKLGRTPFHLAAICYGSLQASLVGQTLLNASASLSAVAGLPWESPDAFIAKLQHDAAGFSPTDYEQSIAKVVQADAPSVARPYTSKSSGGWPVSNGASVDLNADPHGRCDVTVIEAPVSKHVMETLLLSSRPALLRAEALKYKIRDRWQKESFLEAHGDRQILVGTIPYAAQFNLEENLTTVRSYVETVVDADGRQEIGSAPNYAFGHDFVKKNPELAEEFDKVPRILQGVAPHGLHIKHSGTQFYLGPTRSGAMMHFHNHAVNVLAYGRKRWFLLPPNEAVYSKRPAAEWMRDERYARGSPLEPWECVQEAGDIFYVPRAWGHATINVEASIGVAYEFRFAE